jgi:trimethylamine--corrinoid protein Co-methyltransferase
MSDIHTIRPRITVLSQEQVNLVHQYSLDILSSVGVRVDSEQARRAFAQAGAPADESDVVRIPPALVERALETAPGSIDVYDRRGKRAFCLGDDQARFGIGVTALYYQDPQTDEVQPFARSHMASTCRLGDALPSFDVISTIGIIQDVAPEVADLYSVLEMTANAVKPLVILVSDEERFPDVLELLEHLHGDLASRPFIVPYFNPISPLVLNKGTADKMLVAIQRGLPFIFSNYGMAGATTPITQAGSLALLNAELLAGLTFSQMLKEGAPIILGSLPAFFDMRGMGNFYDPISYLLDLACAEMMAFYGLPHSGTSGSGMGWGADLITSGHQWTNHLVSCMGKIGLAPFVGDILESKAFSPAVIVQANEIIAQARRLAAGFDLDDASVGLDEIAQVGPGGSFLMSKTTLKRFRQAYYVSDIFDNLSLEDWQAQGQPQPVDLLRNYTRQLIDGLQAPEDHAELMGRGQAFIQDWKAHI